MTRIVDENISLINDNSIIGIEWYDGDRNTLVEGPNSGFRGMAWDTLSIRKSWTANSKLIYCEDVLKRKPSSFRVKENKVFLFNTPKELFNWLSKCEYNDRRE